MKKNLLICSLLLFSFLASGCQEGNIDLNATETLTSTPLIFPTNTAEPTITVTATSTTFSTETKTMTPSPAPTETLTKAPTEITCKEVYGNLERFEITSDLMDDPFVFRVYTPPCYQDGIEEDYPVMYLLHGLGFDDDQWVRLGVVEAMDRMITEKTIPPFILILPKDNEGTSPLNDPFGMAFMDELMPYIEENYQVRTEREFVGIGGISRGAAWAVHLGMQHWESFGVIGLHSLPVFYYDEWKVPIWLDEIPDGEFARVYLDIGKRDRPQVLESAEWFTDVLDQRWLPYEYHLFNGTHTEDYWASHIEDYLLWYSAEWGE